MKAASTIEKNLGKTHIADREWPWLAGVAAAHAVVLGGLIMGIGAPPLPVTPPRIVGMLVSDVPAAATHSPGKPMPKAAAPEPRKAQRAPEKTPQAKPSTRPSAPPSERAVSAVPSAQPARAAVVHSGGADAGSAPLSMPRTDAAHLNNPKPVYPSLSRRMGEQGRVLLSVYILPDGSVGDIRVKQSSGFGRLDQAALDAVKRWRYIPARRGNEPIPYWYVQPISFSLDA